MQVICVIAFIVGWVIGDHLIDWNKDALECHEEKSKEILIEGEES